MLAVQGIRVAFDEKPVLDGIDLSVAGGEVVAVMGPSGSGKSTLLRVIAGLQEAEGTVSWEGRPVDALPPHRRRFGLMFQDYALFPHRTVAGNVAFGLRMLGLSRERIRGRVTEVLDLVGLPGYGERSVATLSGGEQQRVALARTLAPEPRALLLDEPLGALDRTLRDRLLDEMAAIFDRLDLPVLVVTHDREEAFALGDRIAVLHRGRLERFGAPEEIWRDPQTSFVARILGLSNVLETPGSGTVRLGELELLVPPGARGLVVPETALRLDPSGPLRGKALRRTFHGTGYRTVVELDDGTVLAFEGAVAVDSGTELRLRLDVAAVAPLRE